MSQQRGIVVDRVQLVNQARPGSPVVLAIKATREAKGQKVARDCRAPAANQADQDNRASPAHQVRLARMDIPARRVVPEPPGHQARQDFPELVVHQG